MHVTDLSPLLSGFESDLVLSTRIRVARNLKGFPLGPAMTRDQRTQVMHKVVQSLESFTGELEGQFYHLKDLDD